MPPTNPSRASSSLTLALLPVALGLIFVPIIRHDFALPALFASLGFSLVATIATWKLIPLLSETFKNRSLQGKDRLKDNGDYIPESMGLICASIYILLLILFIPFLFTDFLKNRSNGQTKEGLQRIVQDEFPHQQLSVYLAALLCLLSATLLGFLDDVFDIRWRYKIPIPLIASVPLLLVYYAEQGNTHVVLPKFVRTLVGTKIVELGPLYYLYMSLLSTFCTNSINIYAGINGIEVSQALIIAISVALNDLFYIPLPFTLRWHQLRMGGVYGAGMAWGSRELVERHLLSLYFMLPLIGVCLGFLRHNWYPARAFPGDTLCYFSGMAFAVVGIIGHFSKTLLLFFIPQILNFLLSCPQLFGLVPCPRHRMPQPQPSMTEKIDPKDAKLDSKGRKLIYPSSVEFTTKAPATHTRFVLNLLSLLGLTRLKRHPKTHVIQSATNLTLLNAILVIRGPMSEERLTQECMALQVAGSMLAFGIRYGLASVFYDGDRR